MWQNTDTEEEPEPGLTVLEENAEANEENAEAGETSPPADEPSDDEMPRRSWWQRLLRRRQRQAAPESLVEPLLEPPSQNDDVEAPEAPSPATEAAE